MRNKHNFNPIYICEDYNTFQLPFLIILVLREAHVYTFSECINPLTDIFALIHHSADLLPDYCCKKDTTNRISDGMKLLY